MLEKNAYPKPTRENPSTDELQRWFDLGVCEATDGCEIEPDGICIHGYPSWYIYLEIIKE